MLPLFANETQEVVRISPKRLNFRSARSCDDEGVQGIYRGDAWNFPLIVRDKTTQEPIAIADNPVPRMMMRMKGMNPQVIDMSDYLSFTTGVNGLEWPLVVDIPPDISEGIDPGEYDYDIEGWRGQTLIFGVMPVDGDITI